MLEQVKERLKSFGYALKDGDKAILAFSIQKVENTIKNDCNASEIPEGLKCIAVDMAVGEFLTAKKTFSPDDVAGLDLDFAVKQIQEGDTNTVCSTGAGMASEESLDDVHSRRDVFCLLGTDQRADIVGYVAVAADPDWILHRYWFGISDRLHSQFVARVGRMGLQRTAG